MKGLIVVLFAGWGGADEGIREATGRDPDIAINHDEVALDVHRANHPNTRHLCGDVWHYDPAEVTGGAPVGILWASPTCTFFSKAKGAPLDRREASKVRALAWVVSRWAREARPDVIFLENVEAFQFWGPLTNEGRPCAKRRGLTFRRWVRSLEREGYVVEWRELVACDYGAPTSRKRLFVVARRDGRPIVWPTPSHGPGTGRAYRSAAECIEWSLPCPSIFGRARPLADATLRRIARGVRRFVLESADPFVVTYNGQSNTSDVREPLPTITTRDRFGLVVPSLVHVSNGERPGQAPRIYDIQAPLGTVVAGGVKHGLTLAFLAKNYGGHESPGGSLTRPLSTITTQDHHALVTVSSLGDRRKAVLQLLANYDEPRRQRGLFEAEVGTVYIDGSRFEIVDIGMRLLVPRELARAHDFDDSRALEVAASGKHISKTKQISLIGNSVPKMPAFALVSSNLSFAEAGAA